MDAYQAVLLVLAGLLVGALVPVVIQLALTLREVRKLVEQAGPAVAAATATVDRLDRITLQLEEGGRVERALAAVDSLSTTVAKLQDTARLASTVASAVVPAVAAAVGAWRDAGDEPHAGGGAPPSPAKPGQEAA